MNSNQSVYFKICIFFSKNKIIRKIGSKIISEKLVKSSNYYNDKYNLNAEQISAGALGIFILIIGFGMLISIILYYLILIPFVLLLSIISTLTFYFKIINQFQNEALEISKYADLITEDFVFALKTSQSIYQAIKFIAEGNYPIISQAFKKIVYKVNYGQDPAKFLLDFLKNQPSEILRSNLSPLLVGVDVDEQYERLLGEESQLIIRNEYERKTLQLESKLMLITTLNIFIPIILGLGLIFYGLGQGPLIFLIIPLQIILSYILKNKLLKRHEHIIGG
jgi:hypothetical protein